LQIMLRGFDMLIDHALELCSGDRADCDSVSVRGHLGRVAEN
jgi:hypothetical protein